MDGMNTHELAAFQEKAELMKKSVTGSGNLELAKFTGTIYYVSADGCDQNDGQTPQTAFRSIERVKQLSLQAGDAVLFRRGDLFRGHSFIVPSGVTISAWGRGAKPTVCGSMQNYADPALWQETQYKGLWTCTLPFQNVGLITFDHHPQTVGKYDVLCGWLTAPVVDLKDHSLYVFPDPPPRQLKNDLEFWTDNKTQTLYLRSKENPGARFQQIEIAQGFHGFRCCGENITIDNLHITLMGRHGISCGESIQFEAKNCVLDYIGGSILWEQCPFDANKKNVRFGNAVELYGGCNGFYVRNNWIYQIYDTGITHQCNNQKDRDVIMQDVEYHDNLIEYCFWSIEYYNRANRRSITKDIRVHHNFCRFGGEGWGCRLRKDVAPMYSLSFDADETSDYVTENNIFQFCTGAIICIFGEETVPRGFIFRNNTYIQKEGGTFAQHRFFSGKTTQQLLFSGTEPEKYLKQTLKEEGATLFMVK
jgi:hypothetical protein